jgi:hypothetical protein
LDGCPNPGVCGRGEQLRNRPGPARRTQGNQPGGQGIRSRNGDRPSGDDARRKVVPSSNKITPDTTQSDITGLTKDSQSLIKDLTDKPAGNDWDAAYMSKQVDEHKAVLDKLQNFEKSTTNTKPKDLLNTAVGKVQSHLTKAQDVKDNKIKA